MFKGRLACIIIELTLLFVSKAAFADALLFYKEINLIGGYSDEEKWVGRSSGLKNSAGFEYYEKFSNDYGDYLTADLQMRLSYDSLEDSRDAWTVEIHNAWVEYKLWQTSKLKVGHFDPAFGLEPVLDTHATLIQTLAEGDIGFKKDWGVGLRGSLPRFDYETALQLGSGMSIRKRDGSFLATARIGSKAGENLQYGWSFLYGEVLQTEGMQTFPKNKLLSVDAVTKKRVGLDGQYFFGPYLFKAEASYGKNDNKDVLGYLAEVDYTLPQYQNWEFELQFKSWINDLSGHSSDNSTLTVGTSYKLSQDIMLRAAFSHDFNMTGRSEDDKFLVQFYYFGD